MALVHRATAVRAAGHAGFGRWHPPGAHRRLARSQRDTQGNGGRTPGKAQHLARMRESARTVKPRADLCGLRERRVTSPAKGCPSGQAAHCRLFRSRPSMSSAWLPIREKTTAVVLGPKLPIQATPSSFIANCPNMAGRRVSTLPSITCPVRTTSWRSASDVPTQIPLLFVKSTPPISTRPGLGES
jgi:hypothetical protein